MCSNYIPITDGDRLLAHFGVHRDPKHELPPELYPTELGPFIRLVNHRREVEAGRFGLLPPWEREVKYGRHTYNARSETVHSKPSFRDSWRRGLRCVIPAQAVYEPRYNDDMTCERWRIEREDGAPLGIAGIYSAWLEDGTEKFSYSMVTVNCDDHPFYAQFHKPGDEKRMPIFLDPQDYDEWMACPVKDAPKFFRQWTGRFSGYSQQRAPKPVKPASKAASPEAAPRGTPAPTAPPAASPGPPAQGSLF